LFKAENDSTKDFEVMYFLEKKTGFHLPKKISN